MGNIVFNIAKGKVAYYCGLPAADDAIICVPIETTGIVADATMRDYDTLSDILAGASNEQTTMGRKTVTSVTVTVDDTNDRTNCDSDDITWSAATGNAISALVICYDPDTTGGTDSDMVPIAKYDFVTTPNGSDITAKIGASGVVYSM
jgi:hypothetical protein